MKAVRFIAGLIAVVLIVVGAAVAVLLGPDDTWGGDPAALPDMAPVITTDPELLNVAGLELTVTARSGDGEVFVGAGHPVHVQDYLAQVTRTEISELGRDGVGGSQLLDGERAYPAAPPTELDVWSAQVTGAGEQVLTVPLTTAAPVQIVALPTTAKGETPQVGIGYTLPGAFVGGVIAAILGLLLLVGTIMWGRRAKIRRAQGQHDGASKSAAQAEFESNTEHASNTERESTVPSHGAKRIALVGTVAVLAAGCSIPQQVDHSDSQGVVPLEQDAAQTMLDDYDTRNNAAIKKSHTGDGSLWKSADTGPSLAADMVRAKTNSVEKPTKKPVTFTHELDTAFPASQPGYPLWTAVAIKTSSTDSKGSGLGIYTKDHATEQWRGYSSVRVDGELPTALPAGEATPSGEDLGRAAEMDDLLATWVEKGKAPGLKVTKDLADLRLEMNTQSKGVQRFVNSSDPWGGVEDTTAPGGSVRAVRVGEGLLVFITQEWENRGYLEPNFHWTLDTTDKQVFPQKDEANVFGRDFALNAVILVPDSGDAQMIGSETTRVLTFPR